MQLFKEQTAYKIYAFDRGWRIMVYVAEHLFRNMHKLALKWFNLAKTTWQKSKNVGRLGSTPKVFVYVAKYSMWVFMVGVYIAGAIQYLSAMAMTAIFLVIQSIVLGIWAGLSFVMIALLAVYTFTYSRFYRIFYRCPDCHQPMDIPIFVCPDCHQDHTRLWPSIYGVFTHRCAGEKAAGVHCERLLPSVRLRLGKLEVGKAQDDLTRRCPNCNKPLNAVIGQATNIHLPVVGGSNAGKSSYIVTATRAFKNLYENAYHYTVEFADKQVHQQDYLRNIARLDQGNVLLPTQQTDFFVSAYNLKIQAPGEAVPKLAYIYDAAGEAYQSGANAAQQEYFQFIHGIAFVVDPFSISDYLAAHEEEVNSYAATGRMSSTQADAMGAYERMFSMFEEFKGLSKNKRFPHPIAIVVSKADALGLENEIGPSAATRLMSTDPSVTNEEDALNTLVRDFLNRYGLGHFVQNVEMQFANVRYFSCSALGRMPDPSNSEPFVPQRVEAPFIWLLSKARAIEAPAVLNKGRSTQMLRPMTMPLQGR